MSKNSFPSGTPIEFYMTIQNISARPCNRNVGPRVNYFKVTSGGQDVWNSDDCHAGGRDQVVSIPPGQGRKTWVTWDQTLSQSGCPSAKSKAQPGSYNVVGTNLNLDSKPVSFAIT